MTVAFVNAGATSYSATTPTPGYPASIAAGQLLVLVVGQKPSTANAGTVTTPSGWTLIGSKLASGGYSTTLGADTGNVNLFVYVKVATGSETGTLSVTTATTSVAWAKIVSYSKTLGNWKQFIAFGEKTAGSTSVSVACDSGIGLSSGDQVLGGMVIPTDVTTPAQFSAESFTSTGATIGAATEIEEQDSATGNQIGGFLARATVTAGASLIEPTIVATAGGTTTNVRGPVFVMRIDEYDTPTPVTVRATDTFTASDGAAWPGSNWATNGNPTGGSTSVQGNEGRIVTGSAGSYAGQNQMYLSTPQAEDIVWKARIRFPVAAENYPQLYTRSPNTNIDGSGGYYGEASPASGGWSANYTWNYSGANLPSGSAAYTLNTGTDSYWVIFGSVGNDVKLKIWKQGDAEPGSYTYETKDYRIGSPGYFGIRAGPGAAGSLYWHIDDVTIYNYFPAGSPVSGDSSIALTSGATSTAFVNRIADSTSALTVAATATANNSGVANATAALTLGATATASVLRPAASASALTFGATSTIVPTRVVDGSSSLTIAATASAGIPRTAASTAPLTIAGTATASVAIGAVGNAPLVIAATATVLKNVVVNSAAALTISASATASVLRPSSATAPLTITATATVVPNRMANGSAPLVLGSSATAFNNTRVDGNTTALTLAVSATASIGGQTEALSNLTLATSATATVNRSLGSTAPLTLGSVATARVAGTLQGTAAISVGSLAAATVVHPVDSVAAIGFSATASATVTHAADVAADIGLVLGATAVAAKSTTGSGAVTALSLIGSGSASATRPLISNTAITTVSVTASATVDRRPDAVASTTITAAASASMLKTSAGSASLVMATVAAMSSILQNGGQAGLSLNASATATVTVPSPIDVGDEFLLSVQRELTHAYILENPSTIILRPQERQRSDTGGYLLVQQTTRATQIMRMIESSSYSAQGIVRTETGFQRKRDFQLMGEWDAIIEVDDVFFYDNVTWVVRSFMPDNGYETRAVVERLGSVTDG